MNAIVEIGKSIIPVRMEAMWGATIGVMGTILTFCFGQWSNALQSLAVFMLIDYITGVMAAYMKPNSMLSSKRGFRGIVKKLALATFVAAAHHLDLATGQNVFCLMTTYAFLGNEGLSIIENVSHCGVPVPNSIKDKLEQLAHEKHERSKEAVSK